ncbi:MAG: class I SAM-dependent methyltransferase [Gammaproteobacteria bacterium]|nr:class I SAM-dependent methyltransferase [Gammaproteobacteria bacterium]MDH5802198.1 class I SAM-dependent methyltransferase [Gammaproteobacteria bacterium]
MSTAQIDWHLMAEKFDLWIPHIEPVGNAVLAQLDAQPGDNILDVASGTGEPALTLARQTAGSVTITGTDSAAGMVGVAQGKVEKEGLKNISFQTMPAEALTFENESFDRVLCRFGVMLFQDPLQGLREIHRVLKPQGTAALTVWSTPETMLTMYWIYSVFKNRIATEFHPPLDKVTSLGVPGAMENLLVEAGFKDFTIEKREFNYNFESFDAYWDTVEASEILKVQYDALPDDQRGEIRDEMAQFARDFIKEGRLLMPHQYLLVTAKKS